MNELKLRYRNEDDKEQYQDVVYQLRKHYRGKLDSEIVTKALEEHLRGLNAECDKECE